jgi:putative oxidoreductase
MPPMLSLYNRFLCAVDHLQPLALLLLRLWLGWAFFRSGLVKIEDMENTVALFQYEYAVPLISSVLAAYAATFFELACPLALLLGFGTRLACLPLLAMTVVIYLTYDQGNEVLDWAMFLVILLSLGAGTLSLDYKIKQRNLSKEGFKT